MSPRRRGPAVARWLLAAGGGLLGALGCQTSPVVDGRPARELSEGEIRSAAEGRVAGGDDRGAAEVAEYLLRNRFEFPGRSDLRFLAAEARFRLGDYDFAFRHYRRLLDEDPFDLRAPLIAGRVYTIGRELVRERGGWFGDLSARHDVGVEALNYLVTQFSRSPYADDGWKELANVFFEDRHYQATADIYERLIREYPDSEWVDLALFRVAEAYRRQSRGASYDVEPILLAHAALRRYLRVYPDGSFHVEARARLDELESEVVAHELAVAEYYRTVGAEQGERIHRANASVPFAHSDLARPRGVLRTEGNLAGAPAHGPAADE